MLKITSEDTPHTLADTRDGILYPNHKKTGVIHNVSVGKSAK